MGVLKLKSDKKKKERNEKETKIDYQKCIKKTKVRENIFMKGSVENDFDIRIFMKTDHSSNKIRQLNYAKLVKGIRKNKNLIPNNIEKIIEIYGLGISEEDKNIRNYSSKIFYHLINNINYDKFYGKIKTCLFHSLKIEKVDLKILNLELCHKFFFTKISYCNKFFYEFLNNILDCFISLSIQNQIKNVKYIFLLFKHKAKYKREKKKLLQLKKKGIKIMPAEIKNNKSLKEDKQVADMEFKNFKQNNDNKKNFDNKKNVHNNNSYSSDVSDNNYEPISCRNMRNNLRDPYLIKKGIRIKLDENTKIEIYKKLFQCLYNFMDEIIYNSLQVDLINLYTQILKNIIFVIKKKITLTLEIMLIINKLIKKIIELINENILNIKNVKVLNMIYYFIVLIISLCLKERKYFDFFKKKIKMDILQWLHYTFVIYWYVLLKENFFNIPSGMENEKKKIKNIYYKHEDICEQNISNNILSDKLKACTPNGGDDINCVHMGNKSSTNEKKHNNNNDDNNNDDDNNNNLLNVCDLHYNNMCDDKTFHYKNNKKYAKKYFMLLIYYYEIYMNRTNNNIVLNYYINIKKKSTEQSTEQNKNLHKTIMNKIEAYTISMFHKNNDDNEKCAEYIINYLLSFSYNSIEKIIHLCYNIILLSYKDNVDLYTMKNDYLYIQKNKKDKNKDDFILYSFKYFTAPFLFLSLVDCTKFINNDFFLKSFYSFFKEEEEKIISTIRFLHKEKEYVKMIISNSMFDNFMNTLLYVLYNYSDEFFVNNCLFFFCMLKENQRDILKRKDDNNNDNNDNNDNDNNDNNDNDNNNNNNNNNKECGDMFNVSGENTIFFNDMVRDDKSEDGSSVHNFQNIMNKKMNNIKKVLIDYFIHKNNSYMLSFDILKILYFLYEHTNIKLLIFIYYLIINCVNNFDWRGKTKNSFFLNTREAIVCINKIMGVNYIKHMDISKKANENLYIDIDNKKYLFVINDEYIYKEHFVLFFFKLNLYETIKVCENCVYDLLEDLQNVQEEKKKKNQDDDDEEEKKYYVILNNLKFTNIILIIKNISYIIANMKLHCSHVPLENINIACIKLNYLFCLIQKLEKVNESVCDKIFKIIKIITLYYFVCFYMCPPLLYDTNIEMDEKEDDNNCLSYDNTSGEEEKKKVHKRKFCEISNYIEDDIHLKTHHNDEKNNLNGISDIRDIEKEDDEKYFIYNRNIKVKVDISLFPLFLKNYFNNYMNIKNEGKVYGLEDILPDFFCIEFFNILLETEIYYYIPINNNKNFENVIYDNNEESYNLITHKYIEELINKYEKHINFVSYKKLVYLPIRKIIKLLIVSLFKMSYNRNIFFDPLSYNIKKDILLNIFLDNLNFVLIFYYFISYIMNRMNYFLNASFSLRNYYSFWFFVDIILCCYCIKEEKMKKLKLSWSKEYEEIHLILNEALIGLNKKLKNMLDLILKHDERYNLINNIGKIYEQL
ncbi:conserved Plasmodium membrane protein, unknown function [Plasmodium sp. DRC-Itaito]|nr:conserved Plasmodium membrane protein, unknown function [Plasmodium sp. DRC-Itaito]